MQLKPPQTWGEVIGLLTLLGVFGGYAITQHERLSAMEKQLSERPVLMERRDRETDSMKDDIKQLRDRLLCPCH